MAAFIGGDKLHEKGIFYPSDILKFPWDKKELTEPLSKSEIDELQSLIDAENAK